MKKKHCNSPKWRNFARRCIKNPFLRHKLLLIYSRTCQFCLAPIADGYVIHHMNYDNECYYDNTICVLSPTPKKPNRRVNVPDCEYCYNNNRSCFDNCVKNLTLVHKYCNKLIFDI